jgi:hypothetical protein
VRRFVRPLAVAVAATVGVAVTLGLRPGDRGLAFDVYLLFLGALALAVLLAETGRLAPPLRPSELELSLRRRPSPPDRLPELVALEREVEMARQTSFDAHYRLRPALREVARERLAARGVALDADPGAAERLLGEEVWELVRPDRRAPRNHFAPGVPLEQLDRALASLESL